MKTVYKVLTRSNGKLYSTCYITCSANVGSPAIEYPTDGSIIRPKIGKLFVFPELNDARYFRSVLHLEIWAAETADFQKFNGKIPANNNVNNVADFWAAMERKEHIEKLELELREACLMFSPHGTALCDSLKLIRKIT